jgi:uncharacterized protein YdhG (YjbR/CyaY superfamily)
MGDKAIDVEGYLAALPDERRVAIRRLLDLGRSVFADSEETFDHGMPVVKRDGAMCFAVASRKEYVALYGLGHEIIERHQNALEPANLGGGCVRYRKPEAIDYALIEAMMIERREMKSADGC